MTETAQGQGDAAPAPAKTVAPRQTLRALIVSVAVLIVIACGLFLAYLRGETLRNAEEWQQLAQEMKRADFVFGSMLFGEDLVRPLQHLLSETEAPTAIITSNPTLIRCTRLGKFVLKQKEEGDEEPGLLKRWMNNTKPCLSN